MINNYELIRDFIEFKNEQTFYFVQILKRRKENKEMKSFSRPIETFYIYSKEEFERKMPHIIEKCEMNRARAYIKLNPLDVHSVALVTITTIIEYIRRKKWKYISRAFNSACGRCGKQDGFEKLYLIDLDGEYAERVDEVKDFINSLKPDGDKVRLEVPTKNGIHLMTVGFEFPKFRERYSKSVVDVHEDGNTLLYFPDSCGEESDKFDLEEEKQ